MYPAILAGLCQYALYSYTESSPSKFCCRRVWFADHTAPTMGDYWLPADDPHLYLKYKQCILPSQACTQPVTSKIFKAVIHKAMRKDFYMVTESVTVYLRMMCLKDCSQNTALCSPASISTAEHVATHLSLSKALDQLLRKIVHLKA